MIKTLFYSAVLLAAVQLAVNDATIVTRTCTVPMGPDELKRYKEVALEEVAREERDRLSTYNRFVSQAAASLQSSAEMHRISVQSAEDELRTLQALPLNPPDFSNAPFLSEALRARVVRDHELLVARRAEEIKTAQERVAAVKAGGPQGVAEEQQALKDFAGWKDRYAAALAQTGQTIRKQVDQHFDKGRSVQVVVRFRYQVDKPAVPIDTVVIVDGKQSVGSDPAYVNLPQNMARVYSYVGGVVSFPASKNFDEAFPLEYTYSATAGTPKGVKAKGAAGTAAG